jgi:hypothetical protein
VRINEENTVVNKGSEFKLEACCACLRDPNKCDRSMLRCIKLQGVHQGKMMTQHKRFDWKHHDLGFEQECSDHTNLDFVCFKFKFVKPLKFVLKYTQGWTRKGKANNTKSWEPFFEQEDHDDSEVHVGEFVSHLDMPEDLYAHLLSIIPSQIAQI